MPEWINAENLNIITNFVVIIASVCAIYGFYNWNRVSVLDRKLALYEKFYSRFIDLHETLNKLFSPDQLYTMRINDIGIHNDNQLKKQIHNYRYESLTKNRKLFYEITGFKTHLEMYFKNITAPLNKLMKLYMDIQFTTSQPYENCPEKLSKMLVLDEQFLSIFRNGTTNENEYTNPVLEELSDLKHAFESILKD